jgi:hypothetical protein
MADKSIDQLPVSDGLTHEGLLVVYQNDETRSISGKLVAKFARESVEEHAAQAAEQAAEQAADIAAKQMEVYAQRA